MKLNYCLLSRLKAGPVRGRSGRQGHGRRSGKCPWTERAQPSKSLLLGVADAFLALAVHAAMGQQPATGQQPTTGAPPATTPLPYYLGPPILDYGWTPGIAPDDTVEDIQEIPAGHEGHLHLGPVERPPSFLADQFSALNEISGLQLAVSYTMPFQQASEGPGDRYGGAGDFRMMAVWTLVGRETKNTGAFIIAVGNNFGIGSQPPSTLRANVGALLGTVTTFNGRVGCCAMRTGASVSWTASRGLSLGGPMRWTLSAAIGWNPRASPS